MKLKVGDWVTRVGDPFGQVCEIVAVRPDGYDWRYVASGADAHARVPPYSSVATPDPFFDTGWILITPPQSVRGEEPGIVEESSDQRGPR